MDSDKNRRGISNKCYRSKGIFYLAKKYRYLGLIYKVGWQLKEVNLYRSRINLGYPAAGEVQECKI